MTSEGNSLPRMAKLRVLCIHGYRQNDHIFRERTGAFRKMLKKHVDFIFVRAPHVIPEPDNLSRPEKEQERGWWFSRPEMGYNALDKTEYCIGYKESVNTVEEIWEEDGPFDGVLGFSQGASFVSLLCGMLNNQSSKIQFKFAILVSGFQSLVSPHLDEYKHSIDTCPTFHVFGDGDQVIPVQSSLDLAALFPSAKIFRHLGGHYVPASPDLKSCISNFLEPFYSKLN